jgi:RNA polymerase sigma factor (sigma-70 family)
MKVNLDAEEAKAYLILVRDGLFSIDEFFNKTKFIPDKYAGKYYKLTRMEDLRQIAYAAHIVAIQTFPVNSDFNFFGWASQTIRREIIDRLRDQRRYNAASERAEKEGVTLLGHCEHPEEYFFEHEFSTILEKALQSIGMKNHRAIHEHFIAEGLEYESESYFKKRRRIQFSLNSLKSNVQLRDYANK